MKAKKKDLKIGSVKLVNGGMKGMEVNYLEPVVKNGNMFMDVHTVKKSAPVSFELMENIGMLGNYLLDACGYTTNELERQILLSKLEVTRVDAGEDNFKIFGKLRVLNGSQVINLQTPKINENLEFDGFNDVMKLIDDIYDGTCEYIEGKMMSNDQLVLTFYKDKEGFDEKEFNKLPQEERARMATKVLEEMGIIVINEKEIEEIAGESVDLSAEKPLLTAAKVEEVADVLDLVDLDEESDDNFNLGE